MKTLLDLVREDRKIYKGISKTGHQQFDEDGALFIPKIINTDSMQRTPDYEGKLVTYIDNIPRLSNQVQVKDAGETYNHPSMSGVFRKVKLRIQKAIGKKLYPTYYFDRIYYAGTELPVHADRAACEISISIHIGNTVEKPWPFFIETPDERILSFNFEPGDAVIYKGLELPHWREKLNCEDHQYYHQAFMHYVLQDGYFSEHAYDSFELNKLRNAH